MAGSVECVAQHKDTGPGDSLKVLDLSGLDGSRSCDHPGWTSQVAEVQRSSL